jgi:hypothetical protein
MVKVKYPARQIRKVELSREVKTQHQTDNMNWRVLSKLSLRIFTTRDIDAYLETHHVCLYYGPDTRSTAKTAARDTP